MNANKLPLNQKKTIIAQKFIIAVAERINNNEVIISYINLHDHKEVLRIRQKIENGAQVIIYFDKDYWDLYKDGNFVAKTDLSMLKNSEFTINVNTSNKLLEIENIKDVMNVASAQPKAKAY